MKHVIFVEGASGVGKSTSVQKLSDALRSLGYSSEYFVEGDPDHPLDLCWVAYLDIPAYENLLKLYPLFSDAFSKNMVYRGDYVLLRYQVGQSPLYPQEIHDELRKHEFCYNPANAVVPLQRFTEIFVNLWTRFAKSDMTKYDYLVFDASLATHMTNDLLRNYNASDDELVNHLEELLCTIRGLNPMIFYLSPENVRERLIKARQSRKQSYPDDEKIAFWEGRRRKDLSIIPRLNAKSQIIVIKNDNWDSVVPEILSQVANRPSSHGAKSAGKHDDAM